MIVTDDGSELARAAIPRAAALAVASGSQVLVLRVSHAQGANPESLDAGAWTAHVGGGAAAPDRAQPQEAEPHLSEVVDALHAAGVAAVGSLLVEGDPAEAIVETASRLNADVIVMSSHGTSGLKRAVLGSVAEHVVRHARGIPVLLSRAPASGAGAGIERILLALDGSELSDAARPHAVHLARTTGAELVLVRVTDSVAQVVTATTPISVDVPSQSVSVETAQEIAADQRATAERELTAIAVELGAAGLPRVAIELAEGDAGEAILAVASRIGADLIVMATHGRGGLGRVVFGSVADFVSRNVEDASVLLVRPESERSE